MTKTNTKKDETNFERLKREYEKLRKKYNLPKFDEINKEFEIWNIKSDSYIIREIRRRVLERIDFIASYLLPILNPRETSLWDYMKVKAFPKEDFEPLLKFYQKLTTLEHEGLTTLYESEKSEVEFIKKVWEEWPDIKNTTLKFLKKIKKGLEEIEKEDVRTSFEKYFQ
ncbi:MAG: hypothetical protein ACP5KK_01780 [Candidatus Nanoarchaeia archaeon]